MSRAGSPESGALSLGLRAETAGALERLRDAFEGAREDARPLALLSIRLAGLAAARRVRGEEAAAAALATLGSWLEARVGGSGGCVLLDSGALALAADLTRDEAVELAQELVRAARRLPLASGILLPLAPAVGLAWTGAEARPLELLALVAEDGAEAADAGTGFAHSELYELFERRLARSAPELLERERARAQRGAARASGARAAAPAEPRAAPPVPAPQERLREVVLRGAAGREVGERLARAVAEERAKDPGATPDEIEARVLARADSWLAESITKALADKEQGHREEVSLLQRRLLKLDKALAETESALRRLAAAKSVDPGLASIYREVQGLQAEEDAYTQKLSLMQQILEANLELHARIALR